MIVLFAFPPVQQETLDKRRDFLLYPWLLTAHSGDWGADLQAVGRLSVGIGKPSAFFVDVGANMDYMRPSGQFFVVSGGCYCLL